ncbi:hypothetical protein [Streptomyces cyaneogriseus]|uniref:hypothetical protein n=1 Tax=Streptomyces cyaneogriseus TaxID=68192 RepID=UPI00069C036D|nr:hypothetical protein [Streptomyces cyaneogriseus]
MVDQSSEPGRPGEVPVGVDGVFASARRVVLREAEALLSRTDETEARALIDAVRAAERVFVLGMGRSKMAIDAFAMRWTCSPSSAAATSCWATQSAAASSARTTT